MSLENARAKALRDQYIAFDDTWAAQLAKMREELTDKLNVDREALVAQERLKSDALVSAMHASAQATAAEVDAAIAAIQEELGREHAAAQCRAALPALWTLERCVAHALPITAPLETLRQTLGADDVASAVLDAMPSEVDSADALKVRFGVVAQEVARTAAAPSAPWMPIMVRLAIGEVLSRTVAPARREAPTHLPPGDSEADLLARVSYKLARDDMQGALVEVRRLRGMSRVIAKDWESAVANHLAMQQGVAVLKAKLRKDNEGYLR